MKAPQIIGQSASITFFIFGKIGGLLKTLLIAHQRGYFKAAKYRVARRYRRGLSYKKQK